MKRKNTREFTDAKSKGPRRQPIAREEWDFSSCPTDEADFCRYYEFARYNNGLKEEIATRRAKDRWSDGLYPGDWQFYEQHAKLEFFRQFPEFPDQPWLMIPTNVRSKRCKQLRLLHAPFLVVSPERIDPEGDYPYTPPDTGLLTIHKVYAVEIDLSASNDAILQAFERWLDATHKRNRPLKVEKRGGVTDADLLKALGAFRLLKHFDGDWEEAKIWSQDHAAGEKPLYVNQSEWIKARKKAAAIMAKGAPPSPKALLSKRLNLGQLDFQQRAAVKVYISTKVDRAEARRLNKRSAAEALAEILAAMKLAHKNPI